MSRTARAVICRELNQPVVVEEIRVEPPKRGEVTVKLGACGVCHSDLSATNGTLQMQLPLILGHEAAGEVVEVGEGVVTLALGDHVVSSFIYMCGECRFCAAGRPVLCIEQGKAITTLPDGTLRTRDARGNPLNIFSGCGVMAEYATVHVDNLVKIDPKIPLDRAALVGCAVTTGVGAVFNTAKVEPGATVAVFGCGGVGLNVIQGAKLAGAGEIIAVDTFDSKLEMAKEFGATTVVNATDEDPVAVVGDPVVVGARPEGDARILALGAIVRVERVVPPVLGPLLLGVRVAGHPLAVVHHLLDEDGHVLVAVVERALEDVAAVVVGGAVLCARATGDRADAYRPEADHRGVPRFVDLFGFYCAPKDFRLDLDVLADDGEDFLAQDGDQIGLAAGAALVRQQDLQALACRRRRAGRGGGPPEESEQVHAALLPNSLVRRFGLGGMVIEISSPSSRLAASL